MKKQKHSSKSLSLAPVSLKDTQVILFYKPYNVLCQFTDNAPQTADSVPRSTLKDYIDIPHVYPAGRLDLDSEGLLLLTNNGQFQHRVAHREFAHSRSYWIQVEGQPDDLALEPLRQGIQIQDYQTRPAKVEILSEEPALPARNPPIRFRKNIPTTWLEITLTEGRNRQVRRMTAAVGFPTLRLVRVALANLHLEGLQPGQYRELNASEIQKLLAVI